MVWAYSAQSPFTITKIILLQNPFPASTASLLPSSSALPNQSAAGLAPSCQLSKDHRMKFSTGHRLHQPRQPAYEMLARLILLRQGARIYGGLVRAAPRTELRRRERVDGRPSLSQHRTHASSSSPACRGALSRCRAVALSRCTFCPVFSLFYHKIDSEVYSQMTWVWERLCKPSPGLRGLNSIARQKSRSSV